MQKGNHLQGKRWNLVFSLAALLVVVADQLSKLWIRSNLAVGQSVFEPGFFQIIRVSPNTGAAFGLFQGQSFALTIVSLVAIAAILCYALFIYRRFPLLDNMPNRIAIGLILGGTVGNLIDRVRFGGVTDFIGVGSWWPAFNIADSAVTVGVIIFAYSLLRSVWPETH
jgi:signal peptidase II